MLGNQVPLGNQVLNAQAARYRISGRGFRRADRDGLSRARAAVRPLACLAGRCAAAWIGRAEMCLSVSPSLPLPRSLARSFAPTPLSIYIQEIDIYLVYCRVCKSVYLSL